MIKSLFIGLAVILLTACTAAPQPSQPTLQIPKSAAHSPTVSPTTVTVTMAVSATPTPTATAVSQTLSTAVTVTLTPPATSTTRPAPTTRPTASTTPTPTPTWPAGVNPFTGLPIAERRASQRPLAIKISNFPPQVRPQWGLSRADIVFEHLAEGEVTRFTALFYGQNAERVGSIRSGRLIDLEIPLMYDAAFAYSGASGPVRLRFRESPFFERIISPDFGHGGFQRRPEVSEVFEHTLFTEPDTLRFLLEQRGENRPPMLRNQLAFSNGVPSGGEPAATVEIPYGGTNVFWGYDGAGRYLRWSDGEPHRDAIDGEQLGFENVVLIFAHHQETDILEDRVGGGHYSIEIQIWGEGPAVLLRNGRQYTGRWQRLNPGDMLLLVDDAGVPIPFAPGQTFFQVVPLNFGDMLITP